MEGMRLKVTPEELLNIAQEVDGNVKVIRERFRAINEIVNRSAYYWEADGQTAYMNKYKTQMDAIEVGLQGFSSNVDNLRTISGVYSATEQEALGEITSLVTDVIV